MAFYIDMCTTKWLSVFHDWGRTNDKSCTKELYIRTAYLYLPFLFLRPFFFSFLFPLLFPLLLKKVTIRTRKVKTSDQRHAIINSRMRADGLCNDNVALRLCTGQG